MKKLSFLVFALAFTFVAQAQINTPDASPAAKLEQKVGLTDVTVTYSRPSMKGRTIFGGLVPYDKLWRTGANGYTLVSFSDEVKIGGKAVKAGTYSVFTKPGKESWEVFFYTDTKGGGTPAEWDDAKVVAKTTVKVIPMEMPVETFTITIDDLSNDAATLGMLWEKVYVGVKFEVPTDNAVMMDIDSALSGPLKSGWTKQWL